MLSYLTEVHDHIVKTKIDNTNIERDIHMGGNNDHTVEKLTFNTDEELVKDTEKAEKFVCDFIGS